jgi:hypothetical protein
MTIRAKFHERICTFDSWKYAIRIFLTRWATNASHCYVLLFIYLSRFELSQRALSNKSEYLLLYLVPKMQALIHAVHLLMSHLIMKLKRAGIESIFDLASSIN